MLEYLTVFLVGIAVFFVTGVDDFSVVFLLLSQRQSKKDFIYVLLGTLSGVCVMFCTCLFAVFVIKSQIKQESWFKIFGLFPIGLGIYFLYNFFKKEKTEEQQEEEKQTGLKNLYLKSALIYIMNMSDDVFFNTSYLFLIFQSYLHDLTVFAIMVSLLFLGNFCACIAMIFMAKGFVKVAAKFNFKKLANAVAAVILIIVGIKVLF